MIKIKSPLFVFLWLLQVSNVKYAERLTRFTQVHIVGLCFSHLIYIFNDSSSSLSLTLKNSLRLKSEKKVYYDAAKVMSQ